MGDETTTGAAAGILRRLGALFYDLLLVIALAVVATFAMLPLTRGEAILTSTQGVVAYVYRALLLGIVFGYFGWCWTRTGQTLGMKAWRLQLVSEIGGHVGWAGAAWRFLLGAGILVLAVAGAWYMKHAQSLAATAGSAALALPLMLDFAWILLGREGRSLVDAAGRTRVLRLR